MKIKKIVAILLTTITILLTFSITAKAEITSIFDQPDGGGVGGPTSDSHEVTGSGPIGNPWDFKPGGTSGSDTEIITEKANTIISTISIIGIIIAVITLIILGLKYMVGSVSEKADYKKSMIPYLVGVIFIVGIVGILQIIANLIIPMSEQI